MRALSIDTLRLLCVLKISIKRYFTHIAKEFSAIIANGIFLTNAGMMILPDRPLSHGGHVESQGNKKLCFCTASLALNSRLVGAYRAKTKLFIPPKLDMAAE